MNGGTCQSTGTSYICSCPPTFTGATCQTAINSNACSTNPCLNGGVCSVNSFGLQVCQCPAGYTGTRCGFQSSCATNPCQNGATCVDQTSIPGGTYYCQCPANFYGKNCDYQVTSQTCSAGDNNVADCQTWSQNGFCSFSYTFNLVPVPVYCPNSCSLCNDVTACADSQANCVIWSNMGLCASVNAIDPNLCRRSCNTCPSGTRNIPPTV